MRHDPGLKNVFFLLLVSASALAREEAPEPVVPPTFPAAPPVPLGASAFPSSEFGAGYDFLGILEGAETRHPLDWSGSMARDLNQTIGIHRTGTSSSFRSTPPVSVQPASPNFGGPGGAPLNEVSVEYALLRELDEGGGSAPVGWNVSYARNLSPSLGLVGEIGTAFETEGDLTASLWDFMGGARFSSRGAATAYVEALGGLAFLAVTDGATLVTISKPAIQGGGGVDVKISPRVAIRAGADYRAIFAEGDVFSQLRIRAGLIFGFGGTTADETVAAPPPPRYQEGERPTPPLREPVPTEPPPPEPLEPTQAAPPAETEPAPAPPPPVSDFERGHSLLRQGDFELSAVAFMVHLRQEGSGKFTVAVGLFCERNNVAAHVVNAGYAPEFFIINVPRSGENCFGAYWGLFDSRDQAHEAIAALPRGIRAPGQFVLPVSRVVR